MLCFVLHRLRSKDVLGSLVFVLQAFPTWLTSGPVPRPTESRFVREPIRSTSKVMSKTDGRTSLDRSSSKQGTMDIFKGAFLPQNDSVCSGDGGLSALGAALPRSLSALRALKGQRMDEREHVGSSTPPPVSIPGSIRMLDTVIHSSKFVGNQPGYKGKIIFLHPAVGGYVREGALKMEHGIGGVCGRRTRVNSGQLASFMTETTSQSRRCRRNNSSKTVQTHQLSEHIRSKTSIRVPV